ncbi:MAG: ASCH domain-containing protein [Gammaproteobacteria bacterium]|nr:ASCH domain-containing protein [Pseudomonadota bacterium]TDJ23473.1 MAG: ASCH domain-containing protein [Gammaproteobacteria bacterium]TDJ32359.1 MAG: ASCH domain-containing protein [Gammaproteobacteria bacterium]
MLFTKRLHEPIQNGEVTCSVRIWKRPRVKLGNSYVLGNGRVIVDKLYQIELDDITPSLARKSGFSGVADLLKVAKHGMGENVYLIEFHYES